MNFNEYKSYILTDDHLEIDESEIENYEIDETIKRIKVVRDGQRKVIFQTDKEGYKVVVTDGKPKEVKVSPQEKIARERSQKKGAIKRKSVSKQAQRKRQISIAKK